MLIEVGRDSPPDGGVMNLAEKVSVFRLQTRALQEAAHNPEGATRKLRQAVTRLLALGEDEMAGAMGIEADRLARGEGLSPAGHKTIKLLARKTIKLEEG